MLRATKRHADELGCPIKLHAAQGLPELALIQEWHGKRSIELLGEIGFLGPNVAIPHVYYIGGRNGVEASGADELALLRETGTTVVHCPIPGARHARSLDTLEAYLAAGVNVAIGTDMFPPDIIRTLDYGSNMAKQRAGSQTAGAPADLFRAATLGGARMLGRDDLGRLAPGAKADITVIDLSALRTGPIDDPIRTLLMNAQRPRREDGSRRRAHGGGGRHDPGLDVEAMRRRAQAYFETYRAAYSERDYLRRIAGGAVPANVPDGGPVGRPCRTVHVSVRFLPHSQARSGRNDKGCGGLAPVRTCESKFTGESSWSWRAICTRVTIEARSIGPSHRTG